MFRLIYLIFICLTLNAQTLEELKNERSELYNNGQYKKSLNVAREILRLEKKRENPNFKYIASLYNKIGNTYYYLQDYQQAISNFNNAIKILQSDTKLNQKEAVTSYQNIGAIYNTLGDLDKTLEQYLKALEIVKTYNLPDSSVYNSLGMIYHLLGNSTLSIKYFKKTIKMEKNLKNTDFSLIANAYLNLGKVYADNDNIKQALFFYEKSLKGYKENSIDSNKVYIFIGNLYYKKRKYEQALNYHIKALRKLEKIKNKNHFDMILIYQNIALDYYYLKNYNEAYKYTRKYFNIYQHNKDKNFYALTTSQKKAYIKKNKSFMDILLTLSYQRIQYTTSNDEKQKLSQIALNDWLNYKGSLLDIENTLSMLQNTTKDKKIKEDILKLNRKKRHYAKLIQTSESQNEINKITKEIENLELKLASKVKSFEIELNFSHIDSKQIAKYLKKDELYVDFAKTQLNYFIFTLDCNNNINFMKISQQDTKKIDSTMQKIRKYIYEVLLKVNSNNKISPYLSKIYNKIPVNEKAVKKFSILKKKFKNFANKHSNNKIASFLSKITKKTNIELAKLNKIIIKKNLKDYIKTYKNITISQDGSLRLLPFEALYDITKNRYLIQNVSIQYIPSGKEFLRIKKYKSYKAKDVISIFSDPDYESSLNNNIKSHYLSSQTRSSLKNMGFFNRLPGSLKEEKLIVQIFNNKNIKDYTGKNANEENIFKLKNPKILHIATHGFFINDENIINPMLKSGIILSGANNSIKRGLDEGIVTSLKLSGLKLKGTELAVLSACETGVVDVTDTNMISGLSKSFMQAGVRNIIITLWQVSDEKTVLFMKYFYNYLKKSNDYTKSLRVAKLNMIEKNYHPFYWAGFIMIGVE